MASYQEILSQIESLKADAERARKEEAKAAIETVRKLIREHNLTAADCGFGKGGKGGTTVKAKYRNSATGQTWSGRGLMPKWLREAVDAGRRKEDFLI